MTKDEQYNDEQFIYAIKHLRAKDVYSAITRSDVANVLNCHPNTATKRLNKLAEGGMIVRRMIHDNCFYWVDEKK